MEDKNTAKVRDTINSFDALGYDGLKAIRNVFIGTSFVTAIVGLALVAWMFTYGIAPLIITTIVVTWYLNGLIKSAIRTYKMFKKERNA